MARGRKMKNGERKVKNGEREEDEEWREGGR